jgi:hypothetical protein
VQRHVFLKWKPFEEKKHPQSQQYHHILNPNNSVKYKLGIKEGHAKMNDKWGGHSRRIEKESS